jgi:hypothetical protein
VRAAEGSIMRKLRAHIEKHSDRWLEERCFDRDLTVTGANISEQQETRDSTNRLK